MKTIKSRISVLLIACMMLVAITPISAFATTEAQAQIVASDGSVVTAYTSLNGKTVTLNDGDTLVLLSDVDLTGSITVRTVVGARGYIDGGNYTVTKDDASKGSMFIIDGARVAVNGGNFDCIDVVMNVRNNADLTINGGSLISRTGIAIYNHTGGNSVTVNGGYIWAYGRDITSDSAVTGNVVTVNGGTIVTPFGVCIRIDGGTVNLNGGSIYSLGFASDRVSYGVVGGSGRTVNYGKLYLIQTAVADGAPKQRYGELRGSAGLDLIDGAAIRLTNDAYGHGIRFTTRITPELIAYVNEIKDAGTAISFGTIIAPTETVRRADGFTAEALAAAGLSSNLEQASGYDYAVIDAKDGVEGDDATGYTVRCALTGLKNALRDFSAIAYVKYRKDGQTVTAYGTYVEEKNSRSMSTVAFRALSDSGEYSEERGFVYPVDSTFVVTYGDERSVLKAGAFVPYSEEARATLLGYVPETEIRLFQFFGENGMDGYKLVIPSNAGNKEKQFAALIARDIKRALGYELPIIDDGQATGDREIYVGKTAMTQSVIGEYEYAVVARGNCLELAAESIYAFENMRDYVWELLLDGSLGVSGSDRQVYRDDISDDLTNGAELILGKTGDIRMMSHNVWGWDPGKGPQSQRSRYLYDTYLEYAPDILCLQEVTSQVRDDVDFPLITRLCTDGGYTEVDVKITGYTSIAGDLFQNSYVTATPILYNSNTLRLIDKGATKFGVYSSWLEAFNNKNSALTKSADADKFITWAVFELLDRNGNATNDKIAVISAHFAYQGGTEGNSYRLAHAQVAADIAASIASKHGCPVMMGGDINCTIGSEPHNKLMDSGFDDVWMAMDGKSGRSDEATHYSYPVYNEDIGIFERNINNANGKYTSNAIDHIFCYNDPYEKLTYDRFDIVADDYVMCGSDHAPIVLDFGFIGLDYTKAEYSKNY